MDREQKARAEERMAAYDRLPKTVRRVLAEAAYTWNPIPVWQRYATKQQNAWEIVRNLRAADDDKRLERQVR